jgi:hypothetical protein
VAKKNPRPVWWKNTFFWFGGVLLILGLVGLGGEQVIRDPGQVREGGLVLIFLAAGGLMLINGWLTHRQSVQHFEENGEA